MNELDCYDLLTLRLGAVFTMSDGEGSDCVLYVKSGNSEDDILWLNADRAWREDQEQEATR